MMKLFANKSFFDEERKKLKEVLKLPLLELVLEYLPHLQDTEREQDDTWEVIAIQLNGHQFNDAINPDKHSDTKYSIDELPLLNGVFVKELYQEYMASFESEVRRHNMEKRIYKTRVIPSDGPDQSMYYAFNLPVKESYSAPEDIICTELFYLKTFKIETKANLSKQRLFKKLTDPQTPQVDTLVVKQQVENDKVEACLREIKRKDARIDNLDRENKRLMELNQTLLDELNTMKG